MLESLYLKAVENKDSLTDLIEDYELKDLKVEDHWNDYEMPKLDEDYVIAAGDGSSNLKSFYSFLFYGISSESIIYDKTLKLKNTLKNNVKNNLENNLENNLNAPNNVINNLKIIESSDLNVIDNNEYSKERIRNYMGIFEIKNAFHCLETNNIDYYLYDGSLLGDLIRPLPGEKRLKKDVKAKIISMAHEFFNDEIKMDKIEITSNKIDNEFWEREFDNISEFELKFYLENIEKLFAISNLLKHRKKIVAISKTSTANDYFHLKIPDIGIFDSYSKRTGYTNKKVKTLSDNIKYAFPVNNEFFKSLKFTIFYIRLCNNKNILKVELPYNANKEDIEKIIAVLANESTEGYPYLLKKTHHDVVISKKDMENLSNIVGLYGKYGREMLG
ncbi:DNA double-strand break repair nuclease NurA [Methanobrevibacter curvatus]|uniref:NurA domain protein n=1 Tax=Methanobrevibacter curvatus TaxID=49547 RepID=A0A166AFH2_9EURY|nr:DNA double-strand break repair nuclease NurA [Methanobrevibacter curvatus]KZX11963.1 NurA domain protein [Methanobrevibacter curvatus]